MFESLLKRTRKDLKDNIRGVISIIEYHPKASLLKSKLTQNIDDLFKLLEIIHSDIKKN